MPPATAVSPFRAPSKAGYIRAHRVLMSAVLPPRRHRRRRSEEHTSELQSLMRISYAVFCLKKKHRNNISKDLTHTHQLSQKKDSHSMPNINIYNNQKFYHTT